MLHGRKIRQLCSHQNKWRVLEQERFSLAALKCKMGENSTQSWTVTEDIMWCVKRKASALCFQVGKQATAVLISSRHSHTCPWASPCWDKSQHMCSCCFSFMWPGAPQQKRVGRKTSRRASLQKLKWPCLAKYSYVCSPFSSPSAKAKEENILFFFHSDKI